METDTNKMLRILLRNQRRLMMAVAHLCRETGGVGHMMHSDKLREAVRKMEAET